jgi:hypothetical protein
MCHVPEMRIAWVLQLRAASRKARVGHAGWLQRQHLRGKRVTATSRGISVISLLTAIPGLRANRDLHQKSLAAMLHSNHNFGGAGSSQDQPQELHS